MPDFDPQFASSERVLATRRRFLRQTMALGVGLLLPTAPLLAGNGATYQVKRGDTLSAIARRHGVSVSAIQRANNLKDDRILAGQTLVIPGQATASSQSLAPVKAVNRTLRIDRSRWRHIVAHHSAIEQGNAAIYGKAHERRGMEHGLAYHFVIGNGIDSGDGEIEIGPRWRQQLRGGHVRDSKVNDTGIGICLVGNLENHPPSARQRASFEQLVDFLMADCVAGDCRFTVHKWVDRNHTVCPGKHFPYQAMKTRYDA